MLNTMIDRDSPFQSGSQPLRAQSQGAAALEGLTIALIRNDFPAGSSLSEAEITARTGFSLAAVRGSLARLHVLGWVAPQPRKGWQVQPLTPTHLLELIALRERLEPLLADIRLTASQRVPLRVAAQTVELQGRVAILQERALMHRLCDLAPWAKGREWLRDLWDMSLRAEVAFEARGITRAPLPLTALVDSLGSPEGLDAPLAAIRQTFATNVKLWLAYDMGAPSEISTPIHGTTGVSPHAS